MWNILRHGHTFRKTERCIAPRQAHEDQWDSRIDSSPGLQENVDALVRAEGPGEHDVVTGSRNECGPGGIDGLEGVIG
jgi:hypothetical protein